MDNTQKSLITLHITVMLLGGTALFSQLIPLSSIDITFGRSLFAFFLLFALVKFKGDSVRLDSTRDYQIGILLGCIMAVHWVTYFMAMQYAGVSVGIIALFTFPIISVFLEPFFEPLKLALKDVISALVVLLGIALILPDTSLSNDISLGVFVGIFSALLYSLRNILHRKHFSHYSGAKAMTFQCLIVCPCLLLFVSDEFYQMSSDTLWLVIALGTLFTAVPHALIATVLRHLRVKTFSLVACMQPLYGVVFAILLLGEQPSWQTLVGGLLVVSAAVYETVSTQRERARNKA